MHLLCDLDQPLPQPTHTRQISSHTAALPSNYASTSTPISIYLSDVPDIIDLVHDTICHLFVIAARAMAFTIQRPIAVGCNTLSRTVVPSSGLSSQSRSLHSTPYNHSIPLRLERPKQHGPHLPLPRPPLRPRPRQHGRRRHPALRQDHPGHAAALLRGQPLQPHPRHPRQALRERHRATRTFTPAPPKPSAPGARTTSSPKSPSPPSTATPRPTPSLTPTKSASAAASSPSATSTTTPTRSSTATSRPSPSTSPTA